MEDIFEVFFGYSEEDKKNIRVIDLPAKKDYLKFTDSFKIFKVEQNEIKENRE